MPVSVVVGGQFGSEGKGKVAHFLAREQAAKAVVRVGGTNSGHTAVDDAGNVCSFRQLPAASLAPGTIVILPPGSLIDIGLLMEEAGRLGLTSERLRIDPRATVIAREDKDRERASGLRESIGSTGSGTGSALQRRISRLSEGAPVQAGSYADLKPFLTDTTALMRELLDRHERIVIEGTQGFGLSVLHGQHYPKATSRDTTAASFVGEAGLSPLDVDDVVLVIRSFPIRVAGDSGPLPNEITWTDIATEAGLPSDYHELTTATHRVRRVARFDPDVIIRAIAANRPTKIVLNHIDYIDGSARNGICSPRVLSFVDSVEEKIGQQVFMVGTGPAKLLARDRLELEAGAKRGRGVPAPTSSRSADTSQSASSPELAH